MVKTPLRKDSSFGNRFRERLLVERRALFQEYLETEEDLQTLEAFDRGEPEVEERAQQNALARLLARLEDQQQLRLRDIQDALRRFVAGTFGRCERCGEEVSLERLEAVPAARYCIECARAVEEEERRSAPGRPETPSAEPPVPPDYAALSDQEVAATVREEIHEIGREGLEDVRVRAESGRVILDGEVPTEEHRQMAVEIIADRTGLAVTDSLRVARFPYESDDRVPRPEVPPEQPEVETALEVEEESEDVLEVEEKGIDFSPPDRPVRSPRKE